MGRTDWAQAEQALDSVSGPLWVNSGDTSRYGLNDSVPESEAKQLNSSLFLIRPVDLVISVEHEWDNPNWKARARFEFNGTSYWLSVTDPYVQRAFPKEGEYPIEDAILCTSLGGLFRGRYYKLVAGVLTPDRLVP